LATLWFDEYFLAIDITKNLPLPDAALSLELISINRLWLDLGSGIASPPFMGKHCLGDVSFSWLNDCFPLWLLVVYPVELNWVRVLVGKDDFDF